MKILLLQDRLRGGGTERHTVFLARSFAEAGHEVTLLTFRPGGAVAATAADGGFTLRALQPFDTGLDWFGPGLTRAVRQAGPDIVLCMGRVANSYAARLQRRLRRVAVVPTLRTGKPLNPFFRHSLRVTCHVISNSEFARWTLAAPCGAAERCTVIPNAILHPGLLALAPAPTQPPVLLCVAQFRREKGQLTLLRIAATLPRELPWRLEFVGDGPTRRHAEQLARRLHLADRVTFHGWVADPSPLYRTATLGVLASETESLPNFLIEAQCAGLPVVTFDVGGAGECVDREVSGFVVPMGDRAAFATAVTRLLANEDRRRAMAEAALRFARDRFDPRREVVAHLELFTRLVGPGR